MLGQMMSNTDHFLPIRASARSLQRLFEPGGPLHSLNIKTVSGMFSMAVFRGLTYHSEFVQQQTYFANADAFLAAVENLPKSQFVLADCYGGRVQKYRVAGYEKNVKAYEEKVQLPSVNSWLVRDTPSSPAHHSDSPSHGVPPHVSSPTPPPASESPAPASPSQDAPANEAHPPTPPPVKPKYEDVLDTILAAKLPFLGPLTAHLFVADYVGCGLVEPPDAATMARVICRIKAGAVAGLHALDYFHNREVLDYIKEEAFIKLYEYLDKELKEDEKRLLDWGPICLEHALCKFYRFVSSLTFASFFTASDFTTKLWYS
jgi:hypothetical protein